jgi:hypothetical protein
VIFRGTPPPMFGKLLITAFGVASVALFFVTVSHPLVRMACGGLIVMFVWQAVARRSVVSAAAIDVDDRCVRIDPTSFLVPTREIPLGAVAHFAAQTQTEIAHVRQRITIETSRWYTVHVQLKNGGQKIIAAFRERDHALFVAQRLDALGERASRVPNPTPARRFVPTPYR